MFEKGERKEWFEKEKGKRIFKRQKKQLIIFPPNSFSRHVAHRQMVLFKTDLWCCVSNPIFCFIFASFFLEANRYVSQMGKCRKIKCFRAMTNGYPISLI